MGPALGFADRRDASRFGVELRLHQQHVETNVLWQRLFAVD